MLHTSNSIRRCSRLIAMFHQLPVQDPEIWQSSALLSCGFCETSSSSSLMTADRCVQYAEMTLRMAWHVKLSCVLYTMHLLPFDTACCLTCTWVEYLHGTVACRSPHVTTWRSASRTWQGLLRASRHATRQVAQNAVLDHRPSRCVLL